MTSELLERARIQVRESVDDARRAVWNLRHESANGNGLISSLERLAQQLAITSGVSISCKADGTPVPLDARVEHDLVMIAKEAMLNAVHHGRPQSVLLSWSFGPDRLQVRVTDDGCGFEPATAITRAGDHYGLEGMSERAKQMGGIFTLNSAPGKGTEISVTVPILRRVSGG
jgi:signal transduction histidine kinase